MNAFQRICVLLLRALGVLMLAGLMAGMLVWLNSEEPVEMAKVIFVGTNEDADCAILISREYCVVIDTGEEQDSDHILEILADEEIKKIDCLILTHPDRDHIGGASVILNAIPVRQVVAPYYARDNERYEQLQDNLRAMNMKILTPYRDRELQYGDLKLRIYPPNESYYSKDNNYSLIVMAEHGNVKMLFAGDAQKDRLDELKNYNFSDVDLYKVAYHGRNSTPGMQLLKRIAPEYAVVTAKEPEDKMKDALKGEGVDYYCTVPLKDVMFLSDGGNITPAEK